MKRIGVSAVLAAIGGILGSGLVLTSPIVSGPASAQMLNLMPEVKTRSPEEKEQDAITDKAYRDSLRKIPENKNSVDPWGNVRSDASKAAAPAKQPRTRTGNAAAQ